MVNTHGMENTAKKKIYVKPQVTKVELVAQEAIILGCLPPPLGTYNCTGPS